MSSDSDNADLIQLYDTILIDTYCVLAVIAFLWYEFAITIGNEVELFWRRKANGATVLFFVNRYLVLLSYNLELLGFVPVSDKAVYGFGLTGINDPLFGCMIYFAVLLLLNCTHLICSVLSIEAVGQPLSYITTFTEP
ncbi:hypothetical protein C8Q80DRAFT_1275635 [Daedaleopsis nitida]|nr:hypothetical protein C8Q80DRAFT_1275635 [Daedaleopsis nitida]